MSHLDAAVFRSNREKSLSKSNHQLNENEDVIQNPNEASGSSNNGIEISHMNNEMVSKGVD